jgi:hypothetical protein
LGIKGEPPAARGQRGPGKWNTESVLRRHYLNLSTRDEAEAFWWILPPEEKARGKVVSMAA